MRQGADVIATRGRTSTALLWAVAGRWLYGMHGTHVTLALPRDTMSLALPRTDADEGQRPRDQKADDDVRVHICLFS